MDTKIWEVKTKRNSAELDIDGILDILLENRQLSTAKQKKEFFSPVKPSDIALKKTGIDAKAVTKAIKRVEKAISSKELIIVYGDYDADGVCAAAILWECLHCLGANAVPYIPDRFSEGYGLNAQSIQKLKSENESLGLIITVDNGIVANSEVEFAKSIGLDVIITDHHEPASTLPNAYTIVHTTQTSGSGVAWFFARELAQKLPKAKDRFCFESSLELAAIGTVSDQLPLLDVNRSLVKHGLSDLQKTQRPGLLHLFSQAGIDQTKIGVYEIGFVIAPRLNSAGRLNHAIESLRLVCTRDTARALHLAEGVSKSNVERQKVLDEVVTHARLALGQEITKNIIILSSETYHEGVIGLAASRLVETFYRPAIVISKGETQSKASARSIVGFSIIEAIRAHEHFILGGGGHQMAAGFSIANDKVADFTKAIEEYCATQITIDMLQKKLKIDLELGFENLTYDLSAKLKEFEPTGIGNPTPVFCSSEVTIVQAQRIGSQKNHLRMVLSQGKKLIDAIAFGMGEKQLELQGKVVDVAYNLETNVWNGNSNLQLKIKDIKV